MDSPQPSLPFHETIDEGALPPGGMEIVEVQGRKILLARSGGSIYALDNTCPHLGGSLGRGILKDHCVICPLHHWTFDLETGKAVVGVPDEKVPTYPVRIEKGRIWVQMG